MQPVYINSPKGNIPRHRLLKRLAHIAIIPTKKGRVELSSSTKRERHTCGGQRRSAEKLNVVKSHSPLRRQSRYNPSRYTTLSYDTTKEE
jgi:hypothetical protein